MENAEEILHSLEEFAKLKPKDIPRELEDYLCFVAKTGDPIYQWSAVKSLFREKLLNVITEFYESCPSVEIPPCPNVEMFNYDSMKNFILEKLDTFAAAPFTVQRICELLTTPRKEYNRIDKYMRALEKNILVVSTTEPGNRRSAENGEGIMNGIETEHLAEGNSNNDINVEEMDDTPAWPRVNHPDTNAFQNSDNNITIEPQETPTVEAVQETFVADTKSTEEASTSTAESVITCRSTDQPYVSIEPIASESCTKQEDMSENNVSVTITAIPAPVQKRRDSIEPIVPSDENAVSDAIRLTGDDKVETEEKETSEAEHEVQNDAALTDNTDLEITESKAVAEKTDDSSSADETCLPESCTESVEQPPEEEHDTETDSVDSGVITEKHEVPHQIEVAPDIDTGSNLMDQSVSTLIDKSRSESKIATSDLSTSEPDSTLLNEPTISVNESESTLNDQPVESMLNECSNSSLSETSTDEDNKTVASEPIITETNECISTSESEPISIQINESPPVSTVVSSETDAGRELPTDTSSILPESPVSESVSDVIENTQSSVEVAEDGKETPMEVDSDGDINTETASNSPNVNSNTV